MDIEKRLELVLNGAEEIVTEKEIRKVLEEVEDPTAYVGYEPSGYVHIGWLIITKKIEELIEAGFIVDVLLADWHAHCLLCLRQKRSSLLRTAERRRLRLQALAG